MKVKSSKIGRRRFAFIYLGTLGLKFLATFIIAPIILAIFKAPVEYFGFSFPITWILVDLCIISAYAARLSDVDLSPYCLWFIYLRHVFIPLVLLLVLGAYAAGVPMEKSFEWIMHPLPLAFMAVLSMIFLISNILILYLFFKKGEPDAAIP